MQTTSTTIEHRLHSAQLSPETRDYLCILGAMDDLTNRLYTLAERDYGADADKKMEAFYTEIAEAKSVVQVLFLESIDEHISNINFTEI
ncbi:hypothetical protein [Alistipes sp.]|uniref:hypothetical protein n=1 Tax=Alistipes sp. TaxID=1872444 RepID=UPI003AB3A5FA